MSLEVQHLTIARARRTVVEDVSLTLAPGETLVVVGANGAGKTTLLDGVLGFVRPASGQIVWNGVRVDTLGERARVMSCMPDDAEPPAEVTVDALLAFARRFGGAAPMVASSIEGRLGLAELRRARAGELSRGERRRIQLHAALCTSRPVIVLAHGTRSKPRCTTRRCSSSWTASKC